MAHSKSHTLLVLACILSFSLYVYGCMELGHSKRAVECPHWSYVDDEEHDGPSNWGGLCSTYATCSSGQRQSPINIVTKDAVEHDFGSSNAALIPSYYAEHNVNFLNNGHTLVISNFTDKPNTLTLPDGSTYTLLQFHFHAGSEHTMDGKSYPLELHLVHQNGDGLAVLGFFIDAGSNSNELLAELIDQLDHVKSGGNTSTVPLLELQNLISKPFSFHHYNGSLTTPPCTENVKWFVSTTVLEATTQQIQQVATVMGRNNRPIQATNARPLVNYHLHTPSASSILSASPLSVFAAFAFVTLLSFVM